MLAIRRRGGCAGHPRRWSQPLLANVAWVRVAEKLEFTEAERFQDYGAEQRLGVWMPAAQPTAVPT